MKYKRCTVCNGYGHTPAGHPCPPCEGKGMTTYRPGWQIALMIVGVIISLNLATCVWLVL
jgi:hypothetical protein